MENGAKVPIEAPLEENTTGRNALSVKRQVGLLMVYALIVMAMVGFTEVCTNR